MCGIIGITGSPRSVDVLLAGMARLEYRGYDSAGLALSVPGGAAVFRARMADGTKSVAELRAAVGTTVALPETGSAAGIGHVRWATHGRPSEVNAHPHVDCAGRIAVVHNGIVENFAELAAELESSDHRFCSDTDTEVIAHLLEERVAGGDDLFAALRSLMARLHGTFAVAVIDTSEPDVIVAARRVSPLIVGIDDGVGLVASDIPALLGEASELYALDDDCVARITPGAIQVVDAKGSEQSLRPVAVTWTLEEAEKGGFPDFMSKEIREQPRAVADTLLGRIGARGTLVLDEAQIGPAEWKEIDKVSIVACGSSYHAGKVGELSIEHWARLPVAVDIASEFRYGDPVMDGRTLVVGISQSGETVDTLEAMRHSRAQGARTLVISNVVDSTMARDADAVLYTRAGPEIGVAATKTHLAQIAALQVLALYCAQGRGEIFPEESAELIECLRTMPGRIEAAISHAGEVSEVAGRLAEARAFFFLGRHAGYPVALEGALKLKEISYLHAEGYPAGELKHGPIALIEPGVVVVAVATRNTEAPHATWSKIMANIEEVKARGATVVTVATEGDEETAGKGDHVLWSPSVPHSLFSPLVDVVALQLLAYELARARGNDVDRPRNLAKTVTVE